MICYEYYCAEYMGTVSPEDFQRLEPRARAFLNYYTQGRAKDHMELDAVKMCLCALVDRYRVIEAARELAEKRLLDAVDGGADIKSETVGGYSRTVATGGESAANALAVSAEAKRMLADTCREYLANTGLLYRGRWPS